jgi:mono/diheme cytochrome c family protein
MTTTVLAIGMTWLAGCSHNDAPEGAKPLTFPLERTEERLSRGKYLAWSVTGCFDCHSETDWSAPEAPPKTGKLGGGLVFPLEGLPGRVVSSNITPDVETGAGSWSDDDFYKAMTQGIGKDGRTLFPLMPYHRYREMSDEDLAALIVYVRSIAPVKNALPKTELAEPVKQSLTPLLPRPFKAAPDLSDPIKRGAYLANAADCVTCHTPINAQGAPLPGMEFAGGWVLKGPWGEVAASNITSDPSGIPYYDEAMFIETMRVGRVKGARKLNPLMPWRFYRQMTDEDLKSVFAYVRTLKPVIHRVDNTEAATPCKRCGFRHGLGETNL